MIILKKRNDEKFWNIIIKRELMIGYDYLNFVSQNAGVEITPIFQTEENEGLVMWMLWPSLYENTD